MAVPVRKNVDFPNNQEALDLPLHQSPTMASASDSNRHGASSDDRWGDMSGTSGIQFDGGSGTLVEASERVIIDTVGPLGSVTTRLRSSSACTLADGPLVRYDQLSGFRITSNVERVHRPALIRELQV
jgi:hypothetical protein